MAGAVATTGPVDPGSPSKVWHDFLAAHHVVEESVPLFALEDDGCVATRLVGAKRKRQVLRRSDQMESLLLRVVDILVQDWAAGHHGYDGLIYMMLVGESDDLLPLYIGKAEAMGKGAGNLSANIKGLDRDRHKFARWGDGHAYHIGDLSCAALPGNEAARVLPKYKAWADALFVTAPAERPVLRRPVRFWAKAWKPSEVGIWRELGPTRLAFLEYLLIGVASCLFPDALLNREGRNRRTSALEAAGNGRELP